MLVRTALGFRSVGFCNLLTAIDSAVSQQTILAEYITRCTAMELLYVENYSYAFVTRVRLFSSIKPIFSPQNDLGGEARRAPFGARGPPADGGRGVLDRHRPGVGR
jgi:hypothetical protein